MNGNFLVRNKNASSHPLLSRIQWWIKRLCDTGETKIEMLLLSLSFSMAARAKHIGCPVANVTPETVAGLWGPEASANRSLSDGDAVRGPRLRTERWNTQGLKRLAGIHSCETTTVTATYTFGDQPARTIVSNLLMDTVQYRVEASRNFL